MSATAFAASDPAFAERVRESFSRQRVMGLIGAEMTRVEPGEIEIELPFRADLTQQHGYFHAGIVATIADSAGGYAGYSLMPAGSTVLTVEYTIHLLAPARGERLVARGRVIKSGRTLTVCQFEAVAVQGGERTLCAWGTQTVICLEGRVDTEVSTLDTEVSACDTGVSGLNPEGAAPDTEVSAPDT